MFTFLLELFKVFVELMLFDLDQDAVLESNRHLAPETAPHQLLEPKVFPGVELQEWQVVEGHAVLIKQTLHCFEVFRIYSIVILQKVDPIFHLE